MKQPRVVLVFGDGGRCEELVRVVVGGWMGGVASGVCLPRVK